MSEFSSRSGWIPSPPPSRPESAGQTDRSTHMINTAQLHEWLICICINRGKNNNSITPRAILHTKNICKWAARSAASLPPALLSSHGLSTSQQGRKPVRRCSGSSCSSCPTPGFLEAIWPMEITSFLCYSLFTSLQLHAAVSLPRSLSTRTANPCVPYAHIYPVSFHLITCVVSIWLCPSLPQEFSSHELSQNNHFCAFFL